MSTGGVLYSYRKPAVEREARRDTKAVVHKKVITLRAQVLRVIDARDACQQRKPEQRIGEPISGNLRERGKRDASARLNIAKSILLSEAQVNAKLDQMIAVNVAGGVQRLVNVRHTVLRIVAFVAERRKTSHANKTQTRIARD